MDSPRELPGVEAMESPRKPLELSEEELQRLSLGTGGSAQETPFPLPRTPPGGVFAKPQQVPELWAPPFLKGRRCTQVNKELNEIPLIRPLSERLQVAPVVVGVGFLLLAATFLLYGIGGQLVCTLFGVAFPAFESFKAVEEFANLKDGDDNANVYRKASGMQFWLTYWIVVAAITSFECLLYYVVVWVPFYYPLKLGTLMYLYVPQTRGANHVYNWFVSPFLKRNRDTIDKTIQESGKKLRKSVSNVANNAVDAGIGVGKQGVVRLRRGLTMVGPGIETVRHFVGAEIARRTHREESPKAQEEPPVDYFEPTPPPSPPSPPPPEPAEAEAE
ncbi:HVA22H [Symbiodinium sp. CCMP2592]|nr:HVA22H [Symbiodinium sp. CCMP2592]